jgi:hypothetical protein
MKDSLLAALRERPTYSSLTIDDLKPLPATGAAHGHALLPNGLLARVAYAHDGDPTAAAHLRVQAEAFRYLASAGRTPRLHDVLEPRTGLPGGALIVDRIEGRAPRLPDDLGAIADTLARIHLLPLKVHVGSPAIDLAHATLATSTVWHLDAGKVLSRAEMQGFYDIYLEKIGKKRAASVQPWLVPMHRLTWLRTTLFMARWRVQT